MNDQICLIQSRFSNHHHQTDGFKFDYIAATDERILKLTNVFECTIDALTTNVLKSVAPKYRAQLRKDIAYLIGLRQRQVETWERYKADCQTRTDNTNKWVLQNQR